ncbi:MAG: alpha/beta hydrolase [Rhodospirillaceae bacterium]|nr:alpha/beta hydrolase [Rhodospirillaceae bacterium]
MDYTEHYFSAQDGLQLYYRDYGPKHGGGTPVICLPGLTRNCRDFHAVALSLMGARRVICPDIRGRGKSARDPDWRNYHPSVYVGDVRHMLAALNLHRVFVIGTSMGGIMAMAMAAAMPTSIAGALINDVGPDIDDDGLDAIVDYVHRADQVFTDWKGAADFLKSCFPDMPGMTDEAWLRAARRTAIERPDGTVVHDWDPAIAKPLESQRGSIDLWPFFRALKNLPVMVVRGALSDILSAETLERMHDTLPHLVPVTVPGMGHAPMLTEPQIPEPLNDILARVDRTHH